MEGIATVVVGWNAGRLRLLALPRMVVTRLARGVVFGRPGDPVQQRRVLGVALAQLEKDAPLEPLYLDETL